MRRIGAALSVLAVLVPATLRAADMPAIQPLAIEHVTVLPMIRLEALGARYSAQH